MGPQERRKVDSIEVATCRNPEKRLVEVEVVSGSKKGENLVEVEGVEVVSGRRTETSSLLSRSRSLLPRLSVVGSVSFWLHTIQRHVTCFRGCCRFCGLLAAQKTETTSLLLRSSGLMSRLLAVGSASCWLHKKLDVEVVEVVVVSVSC